MVEDEVCVIIGGRGFVGRNLVAKLLEKGGWQVRIADFQPEIQLDEYEKDGPLALALEDGRARYVCVDVRNSAQVRAACAGVSTVFHLASPSPLNHNPELHYAVNVSGTRYIIEACLKHNVKKLIYTSSSSVVFDGVHDLKNADESTPYPEKPMDSYNDTKAQAERLVLEANGKAGLATIALRPSGVFGPGDQLTFPTIVRNAAAGKLRFSIGSGENMMDFTYVENVVHAHILAEHALSAPRTGSENDPAGKVFFITNGEPRRFWDFTFEMLTKYGFDRPIGKLPAAPLLFLANVMQALVKYLGPFGFPKTDFTPFVIRQVTVWRTFSCARAAKLLGYSPPVPLQEGLDRTVAATPQLRRENVVKPTGRAVRTRDRSGPSKAHALLGGGSTADLLLWRDIARTTLVLASILAVLYVFFGSGWTPATMFADAAFTTTLILFFYHNVQRLVKSVLRYELPDISSARWEIPEGPIQAAAGHVKDFWNNAVLPVGHRLFVDKDIVLFLKVVAGLYLFKWLFGYLHIGTFLITLIAAAFLVPLIYDQYEEHVDRAAAQAGDKLKAAQGAGRAWAADTQAKVGRLVADKLHKKEQ